MIHGEVDRIVTADSVTMRALNAHDSVVEETDARLKVITYVYDL